MNELKKLVTFRVSPRLMASVNILRKKFGMKVTEAGVDAFKTWVEVNDGKGEHERKISDLKRRLILAEKDYELWKVKQ